MASKTSEYYKKNPEARKKRNEYQKKYNSSPEERRRRSELNKEGRKRGVYGKREQMGVDVSHTKSGGTVLENSSKNRARNGANGKSTKK